MFNNEQLISLLDLTSLNDSDTDGVIQTLCGKAVTSFGHVAAVCVYPRFVGLAKTCLKQQAVAVATVANFPMGTAESSDVMIEIDASLAAGVDEIDLVIPYQDYIAGNSEQTVLLVKSAKKLCRDKKLKVILESGAFVDSDILYRVSCEVLDAGVDFIKTSTGKIALGATIQAAETMLRAIKATNPAAGLKISGGIRTKQQAESYVKLASEKMGEKWCAPANLRIGASSLLDDLLRI